MTTPTPGAADSGMRRTSSTAGYAEWADPTGVGLGNQGAKRLPGLEGDDDRRCLGCDEPAKSGELCCCEFCWERYFDWIVTHPLPAAVVDGLAQDLGLEVGNDQR